jgi:transcriptional regulator
MYVPSQFREDRPAVLAQAVRDIQLAMLVTAGPDGVQISHVPMLLKEEPAGWTLDSHVARPNPHWKLAGSTNETVAIFRGPHAYISPSWYASKREHGRVVPTWTYVAVHAHGTLEAVDDGTWLATHIDALTRTNEAGREHSWAVADAPPDYIAGLKRGIVGLRLHVTRVEGAWKMNQHRSESDRLSTIAGLEAEPGDGAVAQVMLLLETARGGP